MLQRKDIHNSDVPELCRSCEARHNGMCGVLQAEQLIALGKDITLKTVPAGTELMANEEPITSYATILSGVVKLSKMLPDGRRQIVGLQFAPDFLGRPFDKFGHVDAEAASTVKLCAFPKSTLDRLLKASPALEHRLYEQALRELDEARDWMLTLGRKGAEEKVASFLLLVASHLDPEIEQEAEGLTTFDLPMSRADMADFLGLTLETVSRRMTHLRHTGAIEIEHNRTIKVPNIELLRQRSGDIE